MNYYYPTTLLSYHWNDIAQMINENYAHEYEHNDLLVMAIHHHHSIEKIKSENPGHGKVIIYQLEPLNKSHWWSEDHIIPRLKDADEVWDYDLDNIKKLKSHGIDAKFKPFLYTEGLKRIKNSPEPDIDILFYGTLSDYRYKFLEKINHFGIKVGTTVCAFALTKEILDEFIGRSKIIIDLQLNDKEKFIQKQTRLYYALINDKCVLSTKSSRNYYGDLILEADNNIDDVLNQATFLLTTEKWKDYSNNSEKFKQMKIADMIDNATNNTNSKSNIAIFYHLYQTNNWEELFQEQINSLVQSGLYDKCEFIHVGINGDQELPFVLNKMRINYNENKILEANTLQKLWEFSKDNQDYKVLYFHSKGVTHTHNEHYFITTTSWRIYLEYFVINKWEECVEDLNEYDCVGTEWVNESGLWDYDLNDYSNEINPHYSGNFWWANSSYISKLDLKYIYNEEKEWARWKSEFWIGTKNPKYKSYHNSNKPQLYHFNYTPDYYMNDKKIDLNENLNDNNFFNILNEINSSWNGHKDFSQWIVKKLLPEVTVDLGVDYGYSSLCFSFPNIGKVYGIDLFEVNEEELKMLLHDLNQEKSIKYKQTLNLNNLMFIKSDFNKIVQSWSSPIDILHIDGWHQYETVKNDFEKWNKFVKHDGVILLHDTCIFDRNFGVHKFFKEIDLPKINFTNSCGLGVVSKNKDLLHEIFDSFRPLMDEKYILL